MCEITENKSLKNNNTFGFDVKTKYFVECYSVEDIISFFNDKRNDKLPLVILGAGSNVLFTGDFEGYVLQPKLTGIEIVDENNDCVVLKVGAGEDWDEFVAYCVDNTWYGVENLSLIPGNVGTCPIQNIGAYGVEVKDVIEKVETIDILSSEQRSYLNAECNFGYRDSIFKRKLKGKEIITHVYFKLRKQEDFKLDYGNLKVELEKYDSINISNIRKAVINVRDSKLPDPEKLGNAGSFFKNPIVTKEKLEKIQATYPNVPYYSIDENLVKIPAGWLIDTAGLKGKRAGDAGVHEKQALVLVNYGSATGEEVLHLARNIQQYIILMFEIELEMEVNVVSS